MTRACILGFAAATLLVLIGCSKETPTTPSQHYPGEFMRTMLANRDYMERWQVLEVSQADSIVSFSLELDDENVNQKWLALTTDSRNDFGDYNEIEVYYRIRTRTDPGILASVFIACVSDSPSVGHRLTEVRNLGDGQVIYVAGPLTVPGSWLADCDDSSILVSLSFNRRGNPGTAEIEIETMSVLGVDYFNR
ncbi:MAG: hypothetical protein Q8Q20_05885 [bacterium]|nr:hypothetical protein [bacterium]